MRKLLFTLAVFALAVPAVGAEKVVCSITTGAAAVPTSTPTTGTCTWVAGSTVLVTCDQDIYIASSTILGVAPVATSSDMPIIFSANQDPVFVYLDPKDTVISVIQKTVAGTCKFMPIASRRPH